MDIYGSLETVETRCPWFRSMDNVIQYKIQLRVNVAPLEVLRCYVHQWLSEGQHSSLTPSIFNQYWNVINRLKAKAMVSRIIAPVERSCLKEYTSKLWASNSNWEEGQTSSWKHDTIWKTFSRVCTYQTWKPSIYDVCLIYNSQVKTYKKTMKLRGKKATSKNFW